MWKKSRFKTSENIWLSDSWEMVSESSLQQFMNQSDRSSGEKIFGNRSDSIESISFPLRDLLKNENMN